MLLSVTMAQADFEDSLKLGNRIVANGPAALVEPPL
jgi:hypothetical protein